MAQFVKSSDLRERISFLSKEFEVDDYGQAIETTKVVKTVWACVREQLFRDKTASVGTVLEGTLNVIIRYQQDFDINTNQRIKWRGNEYEVVDFNRGVYKKDFTTLNVKLV